MKFVTDYKELEDGNKEAASNNLNIAIQRVDKAMSSGIIHKNKAARLKSRLTKKVLTSAVATARQSLIRHIQMENIFGLKRKSITLKDITLNWRKVS